MHPDIAGRETNAPARRKYIGVRNPMVIVRNLLTKKLSLSMVFASIIPIMYAGNTGSLPDHIASTPIDNRIRKYPFCTYCSRLVCEVLYQKFGY